MLICIDDVESIIQAELAASTANATPPPTKLVGVPPSRGRGGNQTPRSESVFITGSQPLPSPSSSHGASPMLDKWAFGMSKIDNSKPSSLTADEPEKRPRGLSAEMDSASERISQLLRDPGFGEKSSSANPKPSGPSLLSQQAPRHPQDHPPIPEKGKAAESPPADAPSLSTSAMSLEAGTSVSPGTLEGVERITVKIADLGNGEYLPQVCVRLQKPTRTRCSNVGRAPLYR